MEIPVKQATALVDTYCSVWNEPDKEKKTHLLQEIWQTDGKYIDPRANLLGIDALVGHIEKIQSTRSGTIIMRTSVVDVHHQIGRFNWKLVQADTTTLLEGLDIVYFNREGTRIETIIGFFGELGAVE